MIEDEFPGDEDEVEDEEVVVVADNNRFSSLRLSDSNLAIFANKAEMVEAS